MTNQKIRVGVIFGGRSGEHEVSLTSAQNVMNAMDTTKYEIHPIGINKAGVWSTEVDIMAQLKSAASLPPKLAGQIEGNKKQSLVAFLDTSLVAASEQTAQLDVIFPVLHGPMGEDGTVQGFLELAEIPYVGCGVTGSAVAMDKAIAKDIFLAHNIPIVPHQVVKRSRLKQDSFVILEQLEATLTYPMFVKPANLGSSVGVTKANNRAELQTGLVEAARYDRKIVVEQGVNAREIEVSILGNEQPKASVPGEVVPSRDFYSYAAKYIDDDSDLIIPAELSSEQATQIQEIAIKAFQVLDCAGLARVDFLMDKDTHEIYLNEVNTMPGFTAISMYPKLWQASGLSYSDLIDALIDLALQRHEDNQTTAQSFDVSKAE
ncbi:MAG: D-alanine--D-alanine ligase [Chloroflexota bacterium]